MKENTPHTAQPYMNPYLAGFGIGLMLLAAFVTMGRGLGGSSAFATAAGVTVAGALRPSSPPGTPTSVSSSRPTPGPSGWCGRSWACSWAACSRACWPTARI